MLLWESSITYCECVFVALSIRQAMRMRYIVFNVCGFNFYGSVRRKYIPIYIQQDATLHSLFKSGNCSTCFGWYLHPSSGAHTTVSTASGIFYTVTAICRYRGRVGNPEWISNFSTIAADSSNGVKNTRCRRYSCMHS